MTQQAIDLLSQLCAADAAPTRSNPVPASSAQLNDINAATQAIRDAQRALEASEQALTAKLGTIGEHMADGDIHSLTGQPVPVVIKQGGVTLFRIIPAGVE